MSSPLTRFISVFATLLEGKDDATRLRVARRSCLYAALLLFFFLVFGTLVMLVREVLSLRVG